MRKFTLRLVALCVLASSVSAPAGLYAQTVGQSTSGEPFPWRRSFSNSREIDSFVIPPAPKISRDNIFGKTQSPAVKYSSNVVAPNRTSVPNQRSVTRVQSSLPVKRANTRIQSPDYSHASAPLQTEQTARESVAQEFVGQGSPIQQDPVGSSYLDSPHQSGVISEGNYGLQDQVARDPLDVQEPPLSVQTPVNEWEPDYCNGCRRTWQCNIGCPKSLFGTHRSGTRIGGWAQFGYHNRDSINFNDRRGRLNLHQLWLNFDKPAYVHNGLGYRFDFVYGIDAQALQATGNGPIGNPDGFDNDFDNGRYGWAVFQAYAELGNRENTLRLGKFESPFGYESIPSRDNFFYSRTYTRIFTEPFSHTGAIANFQGGGGRSYVLGATAGWNTGFDQVSNGFNVITGMRWNPNDNVFLSMTSSLGDTGFRGSGTLNSFIADVQLLPRFNYVFQLDYLNLSLNGIGNDEYGVVNYLFYNVNPCLAFGSRLEWWKSDQLTVDTRSTYDFTVGANYMPHSNVVIRPELRFDWGAAALDPGIPIIGIDAVIAY